MLLNVYTCPAVYNFTNKIKRQLNFHKFNLFTLEKYILKVKEYLILVTPVVLT